MKPIKFITALGILFLSLLACNDDFNPPAENPSQNLLATSDYVYPNSKAFKYLQSRSGSTFETDWENYQHILLSDGTQLYSPWGEKFEGNIEEITRKDIKKEDGWVMVMHTFNEPANQQEKLRYLIFYNQATGMLKVFYFHEGTALANNHGFWHVTLTGCNQAITNATGSVSVPYQFPNASGAKWVSSMARITPPNTLEKGWNAFTMPLAYDPNLDGPLTISISAFAKTTLIINLVGKCVGDLNGTTITDNASDPFMDIRKTVVNMTAEKAKEWIQEKYGDKDSESRGVGAAIAGAAIGAIVKNVVGKAFDRITGKVNSKAFSGQQINMSIQMNGTYSGSMRGDFPVDFKNGTFLISEQRTGLKLGAWNLKENPTVYIHPVGVIRDITGDPRQSDEQNYQFCASGNFDVKPVFNPQLEEHLVKYWVECTPIFGTRNDNNYPYCPVKFTDFGGLGSDKDGYTYVVNDVYPQDENVAIYGVTPKKLDDSIFDTENDTINSHVLYLNNCKSHVTIWQLWGKYGKPDGNVPLYKYVYAPENMENIRGKRFQYHPKGHYLKVAMYMVTDFGGKRDTTVDMRTYVPKFEWDPALCRSYSGMSMSGLQSAASRDAVLETIDRKVIESY